VSFKSFVIVRQKMELPQRDLQRVSTLMMLDTSLKEVPAERSYATPPSGLTTGGLGIPSSAGGVSACPSLVLALGSSSMVELTGPVEPLIYSPGW
jgi:hypothetical protein